MFRYPSSNFEPSFKLCFTLQLLHAVVIVIVVRDQAGSKLAKPLIPALQLCISESDGLAAIDSTGGTTECIPQLLCELFKMSTIFCI